MPRNPRQRRRFQTNKRTQRFNIFLIAGGAFLLGALLVSIAFNVFSKSQKTVIDSPVEGDVVATMEASEEPTQEVVNPDMYATLNDDGSDNVSVNTGDASFTLTALGDIFGSNSLFEDALDGQSGSYDFSYVFDSVKYYTQVGDIVVGNLNTTFGGAERGYKNSSSLNAPDNLAYALKDIGVNVVTTAGEHCLDSGYDGLVRTIDTLNSADVAHLGTYKSKDERDTIFFKYTKGVKVAFLNYTVGGNGLKVPGDKDFCVNVVNNDLIVSDINKAKENKADVIVACMHWGKEFQQTPNDEQRSLTDFLFQNGVDVILGNHSHVLQPMEKRSVTLADGSQKDGLVVYSLGDFFSDQKNDNARNSAILNVKITKHKDGNVSIDGADYVPINMFKDSTASSHKFKLFDVERSILAYEAGDLSLGSKNYEYFKKQLEIIKASIGAEF